jgi:hypothetical protein
MDIKPQDIIVLLKLVALGDRSLSINKLAIELGLSPSQVHAALQRTVACRLAYKDSDTVRPNISNLREFLLHGLPYVLHVKHGALVRGMPTAHAAAPLNAQIVDSEPPPVWPDANGEVRGLAFSPVHKSAPGAARRDSALYELLSLVDAIRGGRAREKALATEELEERLDAYPITHG